MSESEVEPGLVLQQSRMFERLIQSTVTTDAVTLQDAYERVKREMAPYMTTPEGRALFERALDEAWERIQVDQKQIAFYTKCALQAGRVAWYCGPTEGAEEWNNLTAKLRSLGRHEDNIGLIDRESTAILNLIDNPGKTRFSTRGLVVGYVQSGKTGNMAALLAKAAGTPFKFFIVLSGVTDSLRNQTQKRLDADLLDLAPPGRWHRETRADQVREDGTPEKGDFTTPAGGSLQLLGETRHLAVMKKNAGVLRRFLQTLRNTPRSLREQTPFLIIDDEADQASVNSSAYDNAVTVINNLLRQILAELPRVAYVGYTATPYANVLINADETSDLYPRDFIHALEKPTGYFGAEELFGRHALEGDASAQDEEGFSMIRRVQPGETSALRPVGRGDAFQFRVSAGLDEAIRYFILSIAAKDERGLGNQHASMLVHTSMLTAVHDQAQRAIKVALDRLVLRLRSGDTMLMEELRTQWEIETSKVPAAKFHLQPVAFEALAGRLADCASSIEVKVENWTSTDRIDYDQPARRYLVIGGNVLARGLTLEGLMVSLFMRTSSQYDTLMQMGRWFGYREGFADLPRIWMEDSVRNAFFQLATVEEEIRRDIAYYARHNVTPAQFAVRIRKIPGMLITNRNRIRHVVRAQVGYAGRHLQTIRFRRDDKDWLQRNWDAGSSLLRRARRLRDEPAIFDCSLEAVLAFLGEYQVHPENSGLDASLLSQYLRQSAAGQPELRQWHVGVVTTGKGKTSEVPLAQVGHVRCNNRSAMQGGNDDDVSIKALMSKRDLLLDLDPAPAVTGNATWDDLKRERVGAPPLLLLYPIDRYSTPPEESTDRERLNAAYEVLGIGVVLPGDPLRSHDYVTTNLAPIEAEEEIQMDELAKELMAE